MTKRPKRLRLPIRTETAVLTKCARRCCLCFGLKQDHSVKEGQIAHLDDDPSNNNLDNLTWLCLDHHARWHARGNMTKGFTADEVKTHCAALWHAVDIGDLRNDDKSSPRIIKFQPTFNTTAENGSTVLNVGRDVNFNPRITRRTIVRPGPEHLLPEQARCVQERIEQLVELDPEPDLRRKYKRWWGELKTHFRVPTYREIPASQYCEVIAWFQQQGVRLRPKLRRTDNQKWRRSLFTGIFARAGELGMTHEQVHAFAGSILGMATPPVSLSDLSEMKLKRVYDAFFHRARTLSTCGSHGGFDVNPLEV